MAGGFAGQLLGGEGGQLSKVIFRFGAEGQQETEAAISDLKRSMKGLSAEEKSAAQESIKALDAKSKAYDAQIASIKKLGVAIGAVAGVYAIWTKGVTAAKGRNDELSKSVLAANVSIQQSLSKLNDVAIAVAARMAPLVELFAAFAGKVAEGIAALVSFGASVRSSLPGGDMGIAARTRQVKKLRSLINTPLGRGSDFADNLAEAEAQLAAQWERATARALSIMNPELERQKRMSREAYAYATFIAPNQGLTGRDMGIGGGGRFRPFQSRYRGTPFQDRLRDESIGMGGGDLIGSLGLDVGNEFFRQGADRQAAAIRGQNMGGDWSQFNKFNEQAADMRQAVETLAPAFDMLQEASTAAFEALVTGSENAGKAAKKAASAYAVALGGKMAGEALFNFGMAAISAFTNPAAAGGYLSAGGIATAKAAALYALARVLGAGSGSQAGPQPVGGGAGGAFANPGRPGAGGAQYYFLGGDFETPRQAAARIDRAIESAQRYRGLSTDSASARL